MIVNIGEIEKVSKSNILTIKHPTLDTFFEGWEGPYRGVSASNPCVFRASIS